MKRWYKSKAMWGAIISSMALPYEAFRSLNPETMPDLAVWFATLGGIIAGVGTAMRSEKVTW